MTLVVSIQAQDPTCSLIGPINTGNPFLQARVASGDVDGARKLFGEMGREGISSAQATAQAEALKSLATIIALQGGDIQVLIHALPTSAARWTCPC
jgi:pentatricopeptide repeat protein